MVRVKICGICDFDAAHAAVEAGADLLGFHFCSSERHVSPEEAKAIVDALAVRPKIVGVFIDQDAAEVREIAEFVGLDMLQLHGSEQPGFDAGRPVIKVLKVRDGQIPDASTWDWDLARELLVTRKVFIAGGLEPGNVGTVVSQIKPYGVDVSSGVEASVRVKDHDKVRAFVHAVRLAEILS